jgi:hypothetical protein
MIAISPACPALLSNPLAEVEVPLGHDRVTIIDAEDLVRVNPYRWHARFCRPSFYAARTTSIRSNGTRRVPAIYLHRLLLDAPAGLQVDHLNCDTLDNRKQNLELVTPDENQARRLIRQKTGLVQ